MKNLNALSLTARVNDWLAHPHRPRILHVFDQVCNLINENREVLSIVTPQIGNGPFNLVIHDGLIFTDQVDSETPVFVRDNLLQLGDLVIKSVAATLWHPSPDWKKLHARIENILNQVAKLPIINHQFSDSLPLALAVADRPRSITSAQKLAGLGAGLTPAGDDFIMGAVFATWIIHPPEVASSLAEEITKTAAPLTTSLSAAWLRAAGKGEAGILWHEFFDALVDANTVQIQAAMDKILAIGATSGADALAGFFGTFLALNRLLFPRSQDEPIHFIQR